MAIYQRFRLIFDRELADGPVNQINPATVDSQSLELQTLGDDPENPTYGQFVSGPQNFFALSDDTLRYAIVRALVDDRMVDFVGHDLTQVISAHVSVGMGAANRRIVSETPLCRPWVDVMVGPSPVRIHEPALIIGDAVGSEFDGLPPFPVAAELALVPVGGRSGRGAFHVGQIVEPASGSGVVNVGAAADALRRALAVASSRVQIANPASPSQPWIVDEASLAAIDAAGRIFVAPSDLGAGPGLIDPTSLLSNTGAVYNQHPTTFVRRPANVRGVGAVDTFTQGWGSEADGAYPITDYRGALALYVIAERPIASVWRLWLDGAPIDVTIGHPDGADLRRPRDVWNALIAPVLAGGSPFDAPAVAAQGVVPQSRNGVIGDAGTLSVVIGTTRYVQAARCLGFIGEQGPGVMVYTPQVPGGGPRPPSLAAVIAERTVAVAAKRAASKSATPSSPSSPSSSKSSKG